ncbi:MAG: glycerophosphodiester phosphodiesterase family protein [Cyclobacteriaceae bacterium]
MKRIINPFLILLTLALVACASDDFIIVNEPEEEVNRLDKLIALLEDAQSDYVMVVAHRGEWKEAPENSIPAIEAAIELGVDMVELDIRMTKDEELVLMHDASIDRMTNGVGNVADMTLAELKAYDLRNRNGGVITSYKVPTLKEAMLAAKGKILVRIDKAHELAILDKVYEVLEETATVDHACILVRQAYSVGNVAFEWSDLLEKIYFTPGVDADGNGGPVQTRGYLDYSKVVAIESSFADEEDLTIDWSEIKENGARVIVYTGNPGSSGGRDDDLSLINVDEGFGWLIARGVNMIQTDEPDYLLRYLRLKGLHD